MPTKNSNPSKGHRDNRRLFLRGFLGTVLIGTLVLGVLLGVHKIVEASWSGAFSAQLQP